MGLKQGYSDEGALCKSFYCKTPCRIFTGRNALRAALFYARFGKESRDPHELFRIDEFLEPLEVAVSWHEGATALPSKVTHEGSGVHAKMYSYEGYLIFSSQNNGNSPLFETALMFKKKKKKLLAFFNDSTRRALDYAKWWAKNKTY